MFLIISIEVLKPKVSLSSKTLLFNLTALTDCELLFNITTWFVLEAQCYCLSNNTNKNGGKENHQLTPTLKQGTCIGIVNDVYFCSKQSGHQFPLRVLIDA